MADVLLSLKHAIIHPGQLSPSCSPPSCYQSSPQCAFAAGPSASLSCTVYPHQVIFKSNKRIFSRTSGAGIAEQDRTAGSSTSSFFSILKHFPFLQMSSLPSETDLCENLNNQQYSQYMNTFSDQGIPSPGYGANTLTWTASHTQPFFPSMSVNVSMNMTMHGYPPPPLTPVDADNLQPQLPPCHQVSQDARWTLQMIPISLSSP